ncbi:unnamed protein product [Didymodactylos carnosus]|nr:unnamed protein product [Didymodactylos carnosus]CAF4414863.1 unnamed protein product [Didymodactylos carnosus]
MLFGSKIDAPDYTVDHKFIIQYLAFTDGTPSGVIDQDWIDSFVKDSLNENKLKMVESIECVPYQYLTETLQVKLEGGRKVLAKASRHSKILSFDEFDNETTSDS